MHPGFYIPRFYQPLGKWRLQFLNNCEKLFTSGTGAQSYYKTFLPFTVKFYYQMENLFIYMLNILLLRVCANFLTNVSNYQSGHVFLIVGLYLLVFFPGADMDLPFIIFHSYANFSSCLFYKKLLPKHGKICNYFMNIEHSNKCKVLNEIVLQ